MKSFYFDLVALPRGLRWLRALLLLAGVAALSAVLAYRQIVLAPERALRQQQVQAELAKLGGVPVVATMKPLELSQAWAHAHAVSVQLGLPWQNFFAQLGQATKNGEVAFISIEPDSQKGHVVLVAEARTLEAMLQFVNQLQASADFSSVVLQSHAINQNVPEKPVRFRVSASWRVNE
jgi:hypothetical protein